MNMGVRYLVARNHEANLFATESLLLGFSDATGHIEQVRRQLGRGVYPVIDLVDRYDESMSRRHWIDRHKCNTAVIAMHKGPRNIALDDHGKNGAHTRLTVRAPYDRDVTIDGETAQTPASSSDSLFDNLWTAPNAFTLLRLLCLPVFLWLLFAQGNRAGAAWMLVALASTDWIDGYLARRFDQVSEFGKIFDPTVDRLFFFVSVVAILIDGSIPVWFAVAVLLREVAVGAMMAIATLFFGMERFDVTWWGKTATFLLMAAVPSFLISEAGVSESDFFAAVAWATGIPGLALSYWTGIAYVPQVRAGLAAGRQDRADRVSPRQ